MRTTDHLTKRDWSGFHGIFTHIRGSSASQTLISSIFLCLLPREREWTTMESRSLQINEDNLKLHSNEHFPILPTPHTSSCLDWNGESAARFYCETCGLRSSRLPCCPPDILDTHGVYTLLEESSPMTVTVFNRQRKGKGKKQQNVPNSEMFYLCHCLEFGAQQLGLSISSASWAAEVSLPPSQSLDLLQEPPPTSTPIPNQRFHPLQPDSNGPGD